MNSTKIQNWVVIGANRGLGLEFVAQALRAGHAVIATARHPEIAPGLKKLSAEYPSLLKVYQLDVLKDDQLNQLVAALNRTPVDILINNAGVLLDGGVSARPTGLSGVTRQVMMDTFAINSVAPILVTQKFLPLLQEAVGQRGSAKAVFLTSKMGSISDNTSGGYYAYRSSKTALNMAVRSLAIDLRPQKISCLLLHPGWVQTDMGGPSAPLQPAESVAGMLRVIDKHQLAESGVFREYSGAAIAW